MRTALVDLAVWQDVCTVLAPPERLAEEYRRRWQPAPPATRPSRATVAGQRSQGRQGIARLIDRSAEGLIDQGEFEPRMTRLRPRLARLEEQRHALADEAALPGALPLILGRLEDCAATLHGGWEAADWASQRDLIRALGKRVAVARSEVNVVFRIDPYPGDGDPEKKVGNFVGGEPSPLLANVFLHQVVDEWFVEDVQPRMQGRCFLTRFADDFIIGFELEADARRVMEVLPKRCGRFKLIIHPEKTVLVEFKKPPYRERSANSQGTFDFLGFTHYWAKTRRGYGVIKRKTVGKRLRRCMKAIWTWCRENRHEPVQEQYRTLGSKLRGYYQYW